MKIELELWHEDEVQVAAAALQSIARLRAARYEREKAAGAKLPAVRMPEPLPQTADVAPPETPTAAAPVPVETVTITKTVEIGESEIIEVTQRLAQTKGVPVALALIKSFGANKVSELPTEKYAEYFAAAQKEANG